MRSVHQHRRSRPGRTTVFAVGLALAACGSDAVTTAAGDDCEIDADLSGRPSAPAGREIEAITALVSGVDETQLPEGAEPRYDPNFAGAYGDRAGGIIVAVVDCSRIDPSAVAALAGGADRVTIIEVDHSFEQVNGFRDSLVEELADSDIAGDVFIDSTPGGRTIRVHVLSMDQLPDGFGAGLPSAVFEVVEVDELAGEEGEEGR